MNRALDLIGSTAVCHFVVSGTIDHIGVITVATLKRVLASAANKQVIAIATIQVVLTAITNKTVIALPAIKTVITGLAR